MMKLDMRKYNGKLGRRETIKCPKCENSKFIIYSSRKREWKCRKCGTRWRRIW